MQKLLVRQLLRVGHLHFGAGRRLMTCAKTLVAMFAAANRIETDPNAGLRWTEYMRPCS